MKKEVEEIRTKADAQEYYNKNLKFYIDSKKESVLKAHTNKELLHIYNILYSSKGYTSKEMNLLEIRNYFSNLDRALSL